MDIEEGAGSTPDPRPGRGLDHLAASPTESMTARPHLNVVLEALRYLKRMNCDSKVQLLTQIPSMQLLGLSHLHLNQISAHAVEAPSKATHMALSLDSLPTTTPLWM